MICRLSHKPPQRGAALIVAMLVFALATTLIVAMSSEFTLFLKRGANSFMAQQGYAYLRGGEELAGLVLRQDQAIDKQAQQQRDDLTELWAQQMPPYALDEGGWLVGSLEDLQGRFNINSVAAAAPQGQRFTAAQEQFIRLLQTPELLRVSEQDAVLITAALMDWLDKDSEPRDFGAEDDYYFDLTPSYRAANLNMQSVSELRLVAYMTAEIYQAIEPYLSVWGSNASINIHTAAAAVLRTINTAGDLRPLTLQEGQTLLALRADSGFESVQAMLDGPVFAGRKIAPELQARLGETSGWFLYRGAVDVADRKAQMYSVLRRDGVKVQALLRGNGKI